MMAALNPHGRIERARRRPRPVRRDRDDRPRRLRRSVGSDQRGPDRVYWLARADALLAWPLAPLLAAREAVELVEKFICTNAGALYPPIWARAVRRALDDDQC